MTIKDSLSSFVGFRNIFELILQICSNTSCVKLDESELCGNPDFPFTLAFHPHFVLHNAVGAAVKKIVKKIAMIGLLFA